MQMTIDCPKCGTPLLVPESAAGRRARCTSCQTKFIIPSAEEMLDMTVSHMVLEELTMRRGESDADDDDADAAVGHAEPDLRAGLRAGDGDANDDSDSFAPPSSSRDNQAGGTVVGVPVAAEMNDRSGVMTHDEISIDFEDEGPSTTGAAAVPSAQQLAAGAASRAGGLSGAGLYPQSLAPAEARPYLVVREVSTDGVQFAFAARWLRHEVFRCSIPIRCCASGVSLGANQKLSARPMVFVNRTSTGEDRARAIELKYETDSVGQKTPRELVREIGRMRELTQPYDLPMMYYVQAGRPVDALVCKAEAGVDGEEACVVRIPNGQVAVQWLERVNGRCGPEYAQLRTDVAHLSSDAWSQLPIAVRQRLEPWTRFQRGEKFLLYLNDPDFSSNDAGLAGVVITDQRLIYHKYRRLRSVALNQDATLHVRPDPTTRVVRLTLESAGRMARAGKIHRTDMPKLIECLSNARLRVMVGGG